jgi:predicted metal-binding protein
MLQSTVSVKRRKGKSEMKCKACNREAGESDYCESHTKAYENIVEKYKAWQKAIQISWKEYLSQVVKNPLTGEWAREVAESMIESGEKQDGTSN